MKVAGVLVSHEWPMSRICPVAGCALTWSKMKTMPRHPCARTGSYERCKEQPCLLLSLPIEFTKYMQKLVPTRMLKVRAHGGLDDLERWGSKREVRCELISFGTFYMNCIFLTNQNLSLNIVIFKLCLQFVIKSDIISALFFPLCMLNSFCGEIHRLRAWELMMCEGLNSQTAFDPPEDTMLK